MPSNNWQQRIKDYEELTGQWYRDNHVSSVIYVPEKGIVYVSVVGAIGDYAVYYDEYTDIYSSFDLLIDMIKTFGNKSYDLDVYKMFVNEYKTLIVRR